MVGSLGRRGTDGKANHGRGPLRYQNTPFILQRNGRNETAWFNFSYTPIRIADGTVDGIHCALVETTDHVLSERERERQTERVHSLFGQAPSFMAVLTGLDHVYELTNDAYLRFVGQRELVGKSVADVFPELSGQG